MFRIFPHSLSRETGEKVDELWTHLKIFKFLRIKMNDDRDGDDIAATEGTSVETQHKESTETYFNRNKI